MLLALYRLSRRLKRCGLPRASGVVKRAITVLSGADISPDAHIGRVTIAHSSGVVIGAGAVIEDDCMLFSGVVLGAAVTEKTRRSFSWPMPVVRRGCVLGTGAKLLGPIEIGAYSIVGANAVVTRDVPAASIAVGIPARVIGPNPKARTTEEMPES